MKKYAHSERDYSFGQAMLTLRTSLGLTQAVLAQQLGVSRRAVGEWETGSSYPKPERLKMLITLGIQQQVFSVGSEAEEIRLFWETAHQKINMDEVWLQELLTQVHARLTTRVSQYDEQADAVKRPIPSPDRGRREVWGDVLAMPIFYGREAELAELTQWVVEERCRVVSIFGLGGIGKSTLAVKLIHRVAPHFQVVIWRSLRDAPSCDALLDECLQVLAPQAVRELPTNLERRLSLLLEYLRSERALLIFDNLETLLEGSGRMRPGYEGYTRLLHRIAQTEHKSCLLLTSREKARELLPLEAARTPVRSLRLEGLAYHASEQLLEEREMIGTDSERGQLIERYGGNPLALKIVTETIVELFGGNITPFLEQGELLVGTIRELLSEQFNRLSTVEQSMLRWLAILREPMTIEDLLAMPGTPLSRVQVLEAMEALRHRSIVEPGHQPGSFTLQSVVLDYVTAYFVSEAASEIEQGKLVRLIEHGLVLATAREYVRQTQQRLLVAPILARLHNMYPQRATLEERLLSLLDQLRRQPGYTHGYGPANLLALLLLQRGKLDGLNLSQLTLRDVYLQGVEMQDANLSNAVIQNSVFTETFDATWAVSISSDGKYWATASKRGEVWMWEEAGQSLCWNLQAHTDTTALAFHPDGLTLVSGSWDGTIKQWDMKQGDLLWSAWHPARVLCMAFTPNGTLLASGGVDATLRLWDLQRSVPLQTLPHPGPILSLAWSPDGKLLATGSPSGRIRLWKIKKGQSATCIAIIAGHANRVRGLSFSPDGTTLASASWDQTVKLWDVTTRSLLQTLTGHTDRVNKVVWSPDGKLLASCSFDKTIWLWDVTQNSYRTALHGHTAEVNGMAFMPDSHKLLSGSEDGTLRLWDMTSGQCVRLIQGYQASLFDIDWSPNGTQLVSGGTDTLVAIWTVDDERARPKMLRGHSGAVFGVGWSPDKRWLASSAWDNMIRLWDISTGTSIQLFQNPDHADTAFYGIAWSPDGRFLASGTYLYGVSVWDVTTRTQRWLSSGQSTWIRHMAWSPDGICLIGGGDDGNIYLWNTHDGTLLQRMAGLQGVVTSVSWNPTGSLIASASRVKGNGELVIWDVQRGKQERIIAGYSGIVYTVAWGGATGELLISGDSDGMLHWWNVQSGKSVRMHQAHRGTIRSIRRSPDGRLLASCGDDGSIKLWDAQSGEYLRSLLRDRPYERLNITGIRGLTQAQKATLQALGATENPSH